MSLKLLKKKQIKFIITSKIISKKINLFLKKTIKNNFNLNQNFYIKCVCHTL